MIKFSHPGKIGDLLYSLHYCIDRMNAEGEKQFIFNIKTNTSPIQINPQWNDSTPLLSDKDAQFIKPLLEAQPYIAQVTINADEGIKLYQYMCCQLNQMSGELRDYYYQIDDNMYPREFWKPLIQAEPNEAWAHYSDCICFAYTGRYTNLLVDWKALEPYAGSMVLLGTDEEHENFCNKFFKVNGLTTSDSDSMLDCARVIATCRGFLGGQSGLYALAEMMKVPRILITPDWMIPDGAEPFNGQIRAVPGSKNVLPLGGECCTVNRTERLIWAVEAMLKKPL